MIHPTVEDVIRGLGKMIDERGLMAENLKHTQRRCTELEERARKAERERDELRRDRDELLAQLAGERPVSSLAPTTFVDVAELERRRDTDRAPPPEDVGEGEQEGE